MNAHAKMANGKPLADAIWLLKTRAHIRAFLEYEYQFEHLADAIDPLQKFAEQSGLVAAIGQDEVQRLIAAPFERFRAIVAAEIEAEFAPTLAPELPTDYAAQLVMSWELDDIRDSWKWTGAPRPPARPEVTQRAPYAPAKSTVDACLYVARLGDVARLKAWLDDHPKDAPKLLEILESSLC
ncbi:hypothetical protein BSZ19_47080 [Bradyrhizobium japonicum]|uniref:Uncharacterized protein n=1 Tax=Bradyrhizobium japonicum TaxID=375 RepID=A0A1Y2J9D0_BRAJP|nr:hypothetical protein [Bradyrhizobium japonicum]OSJ22156.1 hypothetical protein BSZ19_47080 [Bradyrhizobium japonicum]